MKKLLTLMILLAFLGGCSSAAPPPPEDVLDIPEKMFVSLTDDIYLNPEEYLGKTIRYEGVFITYTPNGLDHPYCMVYRNSPGCCGSDGISGFEVRWDGELPASNAWVEVVGQLEEYEEEGYNFLRVNVASLTVKEDRGSEFVS